jgi:hypothetical protein
MNLGYSKALFLTSFFFNRKERGEKNAKGAENCVLRMKSKSFRPLRLIFFLQFIKQSHYE